MRPAEPSRTVTTFAVGFLALDAILLAIAWWSLRRPLLLVGAVACALGVTAVVIAWRRYRRTYRRLREAETAARHEAKQEVEGIRDLLRRANLHN